MYNNINQAVKADNCDYNSESYLLVLEACEYECAHDSEFDVEHELDVLLTAIDDNASVIYHA